MKPIGYELIRLNVYNFLHSMLSSKIQILNVFKSYNTSINFPQHIKRCLFWTQRAALICVKPATHLNSSFVSNAYLEVPSVLKFFSRLRQISQNQNQVASEAATKTIDIKNIFQRDEDLDASYLAFKCLMLRRFCLSYIHCH